MKYYTRLGDVIFHQKRFTIFITDEGKYTFLRYEKGKFFYPLLEDYIVLQRFTTIPQNVYCSKTSDRIAAFMLAAIISGGLVSNFILHRNPSRDMTLDKDSSSKFEQMIQSDQEEMEYFEISKDPNLDELLQIYHRNAALENFPEVETFIKAIYSYDENLNHYNLARNLSLMKFYVDSPEEINSKTNLYVAGLWYSYQKELHVLKDYSKECAHHELMHAASSYSDDYEVTGFTCPNDPEFENMGGFMVECGDEYFLNRLHLKEDNNGSEMISMIAFSSVMGDHELIRTYYNKTVKDFAKELNTVIGDMEETKNLIRLLDLYNSYQKNYALQNSEDAVEMTMEMQLDMFDRLFDYMAKGLKQNYNQDHDIQKLNQAVNRMNFFLSNDYNNSNLFHRVKIIWDAKCQQYLSNEITPIEVNINRLGNKITYVNGNKEIDITNYSIYETTYINEFGDLVFDKVLAKKMNGNITYFSIYTLEEVKLTQDIDPELLYPLSTTINRRNYTFSDISQIWIVASERNGFFWDILNELYPSIALKVSYGDASSISQLLTSLSFTEEEIKHFEAAIQNNDITTNDIALFLDHIFEKKLEETTPDIVSLNEFSQLLCKYGNFKLEKENLKYKYFSALMEKYSNQSELQSFFAGFNINDGEYYKREVSLEKRENGKKVYVTEEVIENGEVKTTTTSYEKENLTYAFSRENDLILYDKENPEINLFTGTTYEVNASKGEIPFEVTISNYPRKKEVLSSDDTFYQLLRQGILDGLYQEEIKIYIEGNQINVMSLGKEGRLERGYWKEKDTCKVYLTDQGAIIPSGLNNEIIVGVTVNILTNRFITSDPTIYEILSFDEYCSRIGVSFENGAIKDIENGVIQESALKK